MSYINNWALYRITYLGQSDISDNIGQTPQQPKVLKTFVNIDTGQLSSTTDTDQKIYKRNKMFDDFIRVYEKDLFQKKISMLSMVVNQEDYENMTKFINTISRKLKRKNIKRLGYIWIRDIGEIKFEKHFHLIMATERIDSKQFKELFSQKRHSKYEVQFLKSKTGMINYIKAKKLYGAKKQRTYGRSRRFPLK